MRPIPRLVSLVAAAAVATLLSSAPAAADVRLTGFGGLSFIDEETKGTAGVSIALGGLIGFEFETARTWLGGFTDFDLADIDVDAHMTTYMFNAVVRLPTGPIQPYASAGVGAVRVTASVGVPIIAGIDAHAQNFGWNVGGGLYIVPMPFFAIRADVRRFETGDVSFDDLDLDELPLPEFKYWRATAGLTFKF